MSKTGKKRKLQLLKAIVASQYRADKLKQEAKLNILQTSLMEQELNKMKEQLELLEQQKGALIKIRSDLGLNEEQLDALVADDEAKDED